MLDPLPSVCSSSVLNARKTNQRDHHSEFGPLGLALGSVLSGSRVCVKAHLSVYKASNSLDFLGLNIMRAHSRLPRSGSQKRPLVA